jgi:hypothetical protein
VVLRVAVALKQQPDEATSLLRVGGVADRPRDPRGRLEHRSGEDSGGGESCVHEVAHDRMAELCLPRGGVRDEEADARFAEPRTGGARELVEGRAAAE